MRSTLLLLHVAAGTAGLLLGPLALLAYCRPSARRRSGTAYLGALVAVALTAVGLASLDITGLWWLVPFAVATPATALTGIVVRRRQGPSWPTWYTHLMGGSYVALLTGLLVVSSGHPAAWILPAVLAQAPIALAKTRLRASAAARVA
ncbi:MAG: hypothetical protein M3Q22_05355 [Actinomycetota bacterium]|nr:hypothetical protein [Actinomycetota bacterium]